LTLDGSRALIDEVREGRLDLAFTQPPDTSLDDLGSRMFACEGMVIVCAPHHRLAGGGLELADLVDETFADLRPERSVRRLVDRCFAAAALQRRTSFEVNDMPMLLELAAQGACDQHGARIRGREMKPAKLILVSVSLSAACGLRRPCLSAIRQKNRCHQSVLNLCFLKNKD
jgi:DNA-binding transcriptional LysR family regulator